ncbi:MAG: hypothetical protein AB1403_20935 [Candidatus Riflebacteria bacterium]
MGAFLVLTGTILLMGSVIWLVGEILKTGVLWGMLALFLLPVVALYWTFWVDYQRCHEPFFIGMGGTVIVLCGYAIGVG